MIRGEDQEIVVAATGDSMISRQVSVYKETEEVIKIIRDADVAFTNCESLFHKCESYAMPRTEGVGTMMYAEPVLARELAWAGFKMTSLCNNHAMDYGPVGMFSTMNALNDAGIVCAGAGRDLDEAREPKYLETDRGRIALIASCWSPSPLHDPWERASNMKAGVPARPGINLLRVDTEHVVTSKLFGALKEVIAEAGLHSPAGRKSERKENELNFLGHKFKLGNKPGTYRSVKKSDLEDSILSIKDARRSADWVLFSFHCHASSAKGQEYPDDLIGKYARTCIDAGADAFLGHGPHILRGIEVYKQKPIFYGLGNFIAQNLTVRKVTSDQYEFVDLNASAKPSDFYETRFGVIPPSEPPYAQWTFESIVSVFKLKKGALAELKLYPVTLETGRVHRAHIGYPQFAKEKEAKAIIEHLSAISAQWNTKIDYANRTGKVKL